MDNFYVFKTKRRRKNYVSQKVVSHKSTKVSHWMDYELVSFLDGLAKRLNQSRSKVIDDILEDFRLDQKIKQKKFEISDI